MIAERSASVKEALFQPDRDRFIKKKLREGLVGTEMRLEPIATESGPIPSLKRYGYRSFDRQWIIPDSRLLSRPRPEIWKNWSEEQVYLTAIEAAATQYGPAFTLTELIPDLDHFKGSFGGRVYPLWADAEATRPNIKQALLELLAEHAGGAVSAEDAFAYVAAIMAHPAFTRRFAADLKRPGLRLPLTAHGALFRKAAELGREIVWLHTYGERFFDAKAARPKGPPRMAKGEAPFVPAKGAIPPAPEPLPDTLTYDATARRLKIGKGWIENVTPAMWAYEVSGKNVLTQWFSYRRRDRSRPVIGERRPPSPLEQIIPEGWLPEYTSDLIDLLNVLGRLIALEPAQAALLDEICAGPLIKPEILKAAGLWQAGPQGDDPED